MDLDHAWYESDAARDILETLRLQELSSVRLPPTEFVERNEAVNWIITFYKYSWTGTRYAILQPRTIHLAVYLFDYYFRRRQPSGHRHVFLAAGAALLVAAKFEECTGISTVWNAILYTLPNVKPKDVRSMEKNLLQEVHWRIMVPTVTSYIPYYIAATDAKLHALESEPRRHYWYIPELLPGIFRHGAEAELLNCDFFESLVNALCIFSLRGSAYRQYRFSEIAASAVAAARFCIGAVPTWPASIISLTNYSLQYLFGCIYMLLHDLDIERRMYPSLFPNLRPDGFSVFFRLSLSSIPPAPLVTREPGNAATAASPVPMAMNGTMSPPISYCNHFILQPPTVYAPVLLLFLDLPTGERVPMMLTMPPSPLPPPLNSASNGPAFARSPSDTDGLKNPRKRMKLR